MWQSKKDHTSFVKSFLHHEPGTETPDDQKDREENKQEPPPKQQKARKNKADGLVKSFFDLSSLEDDSVSLKVLGI
jgi:hypothetical protein